MNQNNVVDQDEPGFPVEFAMFAGFALLMTTVVGIWILQMAWTPVAG